MVERILDDRGGRLMAILTADTIVPRKRHSLRRLVLQKERL